MTSQRLAPGLRFAVVLALLGYGFLAIGNGLNRAALSQPALARWVPAGLATSALTAQAAALGKSGKQADAPAMAALASKALARAPMEVRNAGLLGLANQIAGRPEQAERAFTVSAQLGWRDMGTQSYWMFSTLAGGDKLAGLRRLDAMLRVNPGLNTTSTLMDPVEFGEELRPLLLRTLASNPPWLQEYIWSINQLTEARLANRALVLLELGEAGHPLGCEKIASVAYEVFTRDDLDGAKQLWDAHCPGARAHLLWNGQFAYDAKVTRGSAFDWRLAGSGEVSVVRARSSRAPGYALQISSSSPFRWTFAYQLVPLAAGQYILAWNARTSSPERGFPIEPTLLCAGREPQLVETIAPAGLQRWQAKLAISADCHNPTIAFAVLPYRSGLEFGDVSIVPAP